MTPVSLRLVSALALAIGLCASGGASGASAQTAARPPVEQSQSQGRAKNVILFLADAGGVASVHAASVMAYGEPLRLHIQQWPNLGLSETSPVDAFVSDSANGMSAIVTGVKTHNGVISQGPDGERGRRDGTPTKTV
ncbi:MAG: alkaline phosphatase, partial [Alphaproteobacteria bacterium]|nr:alkaline phosphatase [Alphaproteobacteria bacterium]